MDKHRSFAAAVLMLPVLGTAPGNVGADGGTNGQFSILSIQPTFDPILSNGFIITWNVAANRTNYLTYADSLTGLWQDLVGILPTGPTAMVATDYPAAGATQRFYRVRAQRSTLVMTLVLDRSGSMQSNGGSTALPPAVTAFIQNFDDTNDIAAMVSFAGAASVDVPMQRPFKTQIENAANALVFNFNTCSDEGLTNALAQNNTVTNSPGQNVVKVIVFFTDGMANTFNYNLNCGSRNMSYDGNLFDPATGNHASSGCTVPNPITSIDGSTLVDTSRNGSQASCDSMHYEAQKRAETWANQARSQGNTIYCIGLGNPNGNNLGECNDGVFPILNPTFLKDVANTPDSATYNPSQPSGIFVTATNASQLQAVFQTIAQQLLSQ
jgi:hypothetical protein